MPRTCILTDSTAYFTKPAFAGQELVTLLPHYIQVNGQSLPDSKDLSLYNTSSPSSTPLTIPPSVDAFQTAFGASIEEFYKKFEEYRRTKYPALCGLGGDQPTLAMSLNRQMAPGSFYAQPSTYIPYLFCVTGSSVGAWTPKQQQDGFVKPTGVNDPRINFCGGSCVVLAIKPDTPSGKYVFAVQAPDGRKAQATFQYVNSLATATPRP